MNGSNNSTENKKRGLQVSLTHEMMTWRWMQRLGTRTTGRSTRTSLEMACHIRIWSLNN